MPFPEEPLGLQGDLRINSAWTNITGDLYTRDPITLTRGRPYRASTANPATCSMTIRNLDGKYTPRNPYSPYYGLIGRNTPARVSVRQGTPALDLPGAPFNVWASTPHAAALAITGDIDVRVDAQLANWLGAADSLRTTEIIGKLAGISSDKAWFLGVRNNRLYFEWSPDGSSALGASSTRLLTLPPSGRMAVRATLDTDNGSGGRTITFYTAPTMTGPWAQFGDPVVQAGTTSIFNATAAALRIGDATFVAMTPAAGRVFAAEVRSGINGTLAANPDFTAQPIGTAPFTDGAGRTWSFNGGASISNRRTRGLVEVSEWPPKWTPSEKDAWTPVDASGILRRLEQGQKDLDSTLRRRVPSFSPLAYWPMEEGENATQAYSPIAGVLPLRLTNVDWAAADSLPSSNALPTLDSKPGQLAKMSGSIPVGSSSNLSAWSVEWVYRLDQAPTTLWTFLRILSTGTVREWYIQQRDNATRIIGKNVEGDDVFSQDIGTSSDLFGQWMRVRFSVVQETGSTVRWTITWIDVGGDAGQFSTTFTGSAGRPTGVASPPDGYAQALNGMAIGHIAAFSSAASGAFSGAIDAWAGETAGARMLRLASEERVPLVFVGDPDQTMQLGPQRPADLLTLLKEAADADGGIFGEDRLQLALRYRTRESLYNQEPVLTLDYAGGQLAPPFEPVEDDQVRNDWTVQRSGGSSGRAVLAEGPLSVQSPPNGIGLYDDSKSLNLYQDEQTEPVAWWLLHLSTWDEARYPSVTIRLHRHPNLIDAVLDLDIGDKVRLTNLPKWIAPGDVDLLVDSYTETFLPRTWEITLNCSPGGPWTVGVVGDGELGRVDTDGSELATAVDSDDTVLSVAVTDGPLWTTDPVEYPVDIRAGGEVMTVQRCTTAVQDTFTRTLTTGWGTADSGQTWTTTGGSASDYRVEGA